jgi:hypothetical protein
MDLTGSEYGPVAGACKHSNKLPGPIKCGKFLDQLNDYQLLMYDSASGVNLTVIFHYFPILSEVHVDKKVQRGS